MFEHYTENARSVMERASQEAQKLRHDHIGTEHLLLGLIEVKEGVAADILSHRQVDLVHAREQLLGLTKHGSGPDGAKYDILHLTAHAQNAIKDALQEARTLKHSYIGTEHLLLGLLHENDGTGARVIRNLGLNLDDIRKDVLEFLRQNGKSNKAV